MVLPIPPHVRRRMAPFLVGALAIIGVAALFGISAGPPAATIVQELPVVRQAVLAQLSTLPAPDPNCMPLGTTHLEGQTYPTGGLEPEYSIWCYTQPSGVTTRVSVGNSWSDTFDQPGTGNAVEQLTDRGPANYRVFMFESPGRLKNGTFVNTDHWMVDMVDTSAFNLSNGVFVSPDKAFTFENGTLVFETDAAAGSDAMGGANTFYEMDVTPADHLSDFSVDTLYGYGSFGGLAAALGCRLERNDDGGHFVCAMYDDSNRVTGGQCPADGRVCKDNGGRPGRVWETQGVGIPRTAASVQGGYPGWAIPGTSLHLSDVWRQCMTNEHDLHCRDRFRMELTKDSIHLFVNGYPAMLIDGLYAVNPATGADNRIPDSWFTSTGVRVYDTSWFNGGQHTPVRFHWNGIFVNPTGPRTASPSFCLGNALPGITRNTCAHTHVPGQPEIPLAGSTPGPTTVPPTVVIAGATSTPVPPTAVPPTAVPATATAIAQVTLTPTAVPTFECFARAVERQGGVDTDKLAPQPAAFCRP